MGKNRLTRKRKCSWPSGQIVDHVAKDQAPVEQLRREILAALDGQLLAPDEPFLDEMTLGDYLAMPDAERERLWSRWEQDDAASWEEVDVRADALPAR